MLALAGWRWRPNEEAGSPEGLLASLVSDVAATAEVAVFADEVHREVNPADWTLCRLDEVPLPVSLSGRSGEHERTSQFGRSASMESSPGARQTLGSSQYDRMHTMKRDRASSAATKRAALLIHRLTRE
jgi:hypothetical protein